MATEASAIPQNNLPSAAAAATPSTSTTPGAALTGSNTTLNETDFLSLLTTQLANQDPLNPVDSTQSVAQLAQFSALQATQNLSTSFSNFESNFAVSQASSMLGETVSVVSTDSTGASSTVTGTVNSIQVVNGLPEFTMLNSSGSAIVGTNGTPIEFTTQQITGIAK
jgi:flagellar basal-body rod modification protein FlgD